MCRANRLKHVKSSAPVGKEPGRGARVNKFPVLRGLVAVFGLLQGRRGLQTAAILAKALVLLALRVINYEIKHAEVEFYVARLP